MLSGSTTSPDAAFSQLLKSTLASRFAREERLVKAVVVGGGLQSGDLAEIRHPAIADHRRDGLRQARIGQHQPAPRGHAIRLVVEPLRIDLGEVLDSRAAQQPRMDRSHAIGAVRSDDGQVRHPHLVFRAFLDEADALDAGLVAGVDPPHLGEETLVDLVDDLELARQQFRK